MLEILKFIFSGFWIFLGCIIILHLLVVCVVKVSSNIAKCFNGKKIKEHENDKR